MQEPRHIVKIPFPFWLYRFQSILVLLILISASAFHTKPSSRGTASALFASQIQEKKSLSSDQITAQADSLLDESSTLSRRMLFAGTLIAAGAGIANADSSLQQQFAFQAANKLQNWKVTPVNKRTGVTVFDVEKDGYNVRFVTYLSRFLLSFDPSCQKWWYNRASDIPLTASLEQVQELRYSQFAAFSASVEVGLQEYRDKGGPARLLGALLSRYGTARDSDDPRQQRTVKEARRQTALLFGLMEKNQPVDALNQLLASIDNGSIAAIQIINPGAGYAPGYGPPTVTFPKPKAGEGFEAATGRAVLKPNGRILRVDVVNRGEGYSKPPVVSIAPPAAMRFADEDEDSQYEAAEAKAILFKKGPNKGKVERIQLTNPGYGYKEHEIIRIRLTAPESTETSKGGVSATATAVLEYEVADIVILTNGTGYAVEKPIKVFVEPPPLTARVNMNDPLVARVVAQNETLPTTSVPSREMKARMPMANDPSSVSAQASAEAGRAAGGCIGRACYDESVEAIAFPKAEKDVFDAFRNDDDVASVRGIEKAALRELLSRSRVVSGASSNNDVPKLLTGEGSSSAELLSLFPEGIGLEYDPDNNKYELAEDPQIAGGALPTIKSTIRTDSSFGPRGRSPIERDRDLGLEAYLRFVASGAICCSGVHLALTPIDVVKTKCQTNPEKYPGIIGGFKRVLSEGGARSFFTGWAPTFVGFFCWGGVSYALTEYFRRTLIGAAASAQLTGLDVPIVLTASASAAFVGSYVIAPFEAVRIRSVFQKDYAPNIIAVYNRMVREEGFPSLFSAVPVTLAKEIPFACAKFTVFDLSTSYFYNLIPAAREDIQLSLGVSLAGGVLGGIVAAIVSNPADVTISQMKKAATETGPTAAVELILEKGGASALFTGLPLRLIFYMLLVSLQFLIYDAVRIALGVGSDDLKLYLDVLGDALSNSGQQ